MVSVNLAVGGEPILHHRRARNPCRALASPSRYGLGKSGWVSCRFSGNDKPPLDVLKAWVDESFRAVAPKKLVASLGEASIVPAKVTKRR